MFKSEKSERLRRAQNTSHMVASTARPRSDTTRIIILYTLYYGSAYVSVHFTHGTRVRLYGTPLILYCVIISSYRTYQRQQPDEHVRLADKVLDVELAADFAGPVGLRTSIHICDDRRRRRRFTIRTILYRRCTKTYSRRDGGAIRGTADFCAISLYNDN